MNPVLKLLAQRIALSLFLLLMISALIFAGTMILPGDVAQSISASDRSAIVNATENFSASDLRLLAEDAVQEPLRELGERIASINIKDVRPCKKTDFAKALRVIKPSADASLLARYDEWAHKFGTRGS